MSGYSSETLPISSLKIEVVDTRGIVSTVNVCTIYPVYAVWKQPPGWCLASPVLKRPNGADVFIPHFSQFDNRLL